MSMRHHSSPMHTHVSSYRFRVGKGCGLLLGGRERLLRMPWQIRSLEAARQLLLCAALPLPPNAATLGPYTLHST